VRAWLIFSRMALIREKELTKEELRNGT